MLGEGDRAGGRPRTPHHNGRSWHNHDHFRCIRTSMRMPDLEQEERAIPTARFPTMDKPKYTAQIDSIFFLARIGSSLRWATLPANIRQLLNRLDRLETRARAREEKGPRTDPAA